MDVPFTRARLARPLFAAMAAVVAAGVGVELGKGPLGLSSRQGLLPLFSLSHEWNLPSVYSGALLFACSALLGLTASAVRRASGGQLWHWRGLCLGFAVMGMDELLSFHESADALVDLNHVFYFDWVVPASVLLAGIALAYLPFLRRLPPRERARFVVAGAIYVGGAVGMELPLGWWSARHGTDGLGYALIDAIEESLEMLGLNLFLLSLVDHLASLEVAVRFSAAGGASGEASGEASSEAASVASGEGSS